MTQIYPTIKRLLTLCAMVCIYQSGMAQTYTVTSTADAGANTLRDAITQVNAGSFTTINFDFHLLGAAPYTITLASPLPAIAPSSGTILVNGYSEPASAAGPIGGRILSVQLNGAGASANGLEINASNVTVAGLAIYDNTTFGISVDAGISNVTIWGNNIGTDVTGLTTGLGNGSAGINVGVFGSDGTTGVDNNITVGTNGDGAGDANEGNLVVSNGSGATLDGGIIVYNTKNSRFAGNIVGLGKDGAAAGTLANNGTGLLLGDRSVTNLVGTNGDGTSDAFEQNIISNNAKNGIWILSHSNGNTVAGNILGLNASGTAAANIQYGVDIDNSSANIIGTNADGTSDFLERNYISSNNTGGILITSGNLGGSFDQNADNNKVMGNAIGVSTDNTTAAGNTGNGILLQAQASGLTVNNNIIGSDGSGTNEPVKGNIIANNSFDGINLTDATGSGLVAGNRISKNSMFGNVFVGIDPVNGGSISGTHVTPNHAAGFSATDPNGLLNSPVITSVTNSASNITFNGFARPGSQVEFYLSDKGATSPAPFSGLAKNFGQGKTFLFSAVQGSGADAGNAAGSYGITEEGTSTGDDPITADPTFSFTVSAGSIGLVPGTYTFSAIAIDAAATSGNVNNTSAFGGNLDADLTSLPLPITLLNFSGHQDGSAVDLQWTTAQEVNNIRFDIERSSNGSSFQAIGHVAGSGTTNADHTYTFTDSQPAADINYYRLKQVDLDGKFTYSKVIVLRNNLANGGVKVFPSAFTDNVNISVNTRIADQLEIKITDAAGRITNRFSQSTGVGINSFNISAGISHLTPGVYAITISGRSVSYTQQIVKE